ncbi:tetratricopeptide (TPR) repeat protein [Actinopolyspora biskrensis]|uniref:Tetratricopeptide (TPR) repeat protein n=1 Tax=Actinopolyspora biskrensis TaxID=1470178 RepID=A0A852Z0N0_9ACTN|nr:tetratricopeptide repeat protein [Actinopolyspora biskrensis]NYH77216.1 tetratricopeptide (TPR) repeat protein [Actinopolyspora biskrensis]
MPDRDSGEQQVDGEVSLNELSGQAHSVVQAGTILGGVQVQAPPRSAQVPRQLPAVPRGFVGRPQQLAALDAGAAGQGDESVQGPAITLVCGTAGVGKTGLVLHWAHRVSSTFPDGQLYVDLRGYGPHAPLEPGDVLAGFLRALGVVDAELPENVDERAGLYRTLLSERRVLVVLDNACTDSQIRPLLPPSPSCRVVVTSRRVLAGLIAGEGADVVRVDPFDESDALSLLRKLLGDRVDRDIDAATALARYSAGLPLALRVAGEVVLSHPSTSLADLVADLADRRSRLDVLTAEQDSSTTARTVFSWSYDQLDEQAARAFRMMGTHPGHDLDTHAFAALMGTSPRSASRLADTLVRAHLVVEVGTGRFDMHDLLRAYAAELAEEHGSSAERSEALHRLFTYYLHAADKADRIITPHRYRIPLDGEPPSLPELASHASALSWLDSERHNVRAMFQMAGPDVEPNLWQLAYTLRGYYFLTKQWKDWEQTHEVALDSTRRDGNQYAEAQTRNNLGLALLEQGRWDRAAEHYEKARELFEVVGDVHGVSNALANRATVLHYQGHHESALRENERALSSYERTGSTRNTAITLRSMALVEVDLGRFGQAVVHLQRALEKFRELELHLDATMALNGLGEVHHAAGRPAEAQHAHEEALAHSVECGSQFERARARHGLGRVARIRGRTDEAMVQWELALQDYTVLEAPEARRLEREVEQMRSERIIPWQRQSTQPDQSRRDRTV